MKGASRRMVDRILAEPLPSDAGWSDAKKGERLRKRLDDLYKSEPASDRARRRRAREYFGGTGRP